MCAFANFRRVANCGLCGETLDTRARAATYFVHLSDQNALRITARQARAR